jgi:hypothetical protein
MSLLEKVSLLKITAGRIIMKFEFRNLYEELWAVVAFIKMDVI